MILEVVGVKLLLDCAEEVLIVVGVELELD